MQEMKTIPIFISNYSLNSILSLDAPPNKDKPEDVEDYLMGPRSIIQICKDNKIEPFFLVENNLGGFVRAYKQSKEHDLKLRFGLRLVMTNDMNEKSTESLHSEHKVIIFARTSKGYKKLLKIYSEAAVNGFYYRPRLDAKTLEKFWSKKDLLLAHPFYYSFLHRNLLYFSNCRPNYNFADNVFFIEKNDLPFNYLIEEAVTKFCNGKELKVPVQSIYYDQKTDFKTLATYRCIQERRDLSSPNMEHFASDNFALEKWLETEKICLDQDYS